MFSSLIVFLLVPDPEDRRIHKSNNDKLLPLVHKTLGKQLYLHFQLLYPSLYPPLQCLLGTAIVEITACDRPATVCKLVQLRHSRSRA